jgi:hypothetical protein
MTRKILTQAVENACRSLGFDFNTGFEYRLASQIERLPAAWLEPPRLEKTVGRREGTKVYSMKLDLLDRCTDHSPAAKEHRWNEFEERASQLTAAIGADDGIRMLTDIEFTPGEFSLTAAGELSMCVTCKVQIPF